MPDVSVNISVNPQAKGVMGELADLLGKVATSLKNVGEEAEKEGKATEKTAGALKKHGDESKHAAESTEGLSGAVSRANKQLSVLEGTLNRVVEGTKFLAGGFLGIEALAQLKEIADVAANTERLDGAMRQLAIGSGVSARAAEEAADGIEAIGYTASDSKQAIIGMIGATVDMSKAVKLAALAQNIMVLTGQKDTEVLSQLNLSIKNHIILRSLQRVLTVDQNKAYLEEALALGKTVSNGQDALKMLTERQKSEATLNALLEAGKAREGLYAESLKTTAGQLRDMPEAVEDLKQSIGEALLPAYYAVISTGMEMLQDLKLTADGMRGTGHGAERLGDIVKGLAETFRSGFDFVLKYADVLLALGAAYVGLEGFVNPAIKVFGELTETFKTGYEATVSLSHGASAVFSYASSIASLAASEGPAAAGAYALSDGIAAVDAAILANPVGAVVVAVLAVAAGLALILNIEKDLVPGATWTQAWNAGLANMRETLHDVWVLMVAIGSASAGESPDLSGMKWTSYKDQLKKQVAMGEDGEKRNDYGVFDSTGRDPGSKNRVASASTTLEARARLGQDLDEQRAVQKEEKEAEEKPATPENNANLVKLKQQLLDINAQVGRDKEAWAKRIAGAEGKTAQELADEQKAIDTAVSLHKQELAEKAAADERSLIGGTAKKGGVVLTDPYTEAGNKFQTTLDNPYAQSDDILATSKAASGAVKTTADYADLAEKINGILGKNKAIAGRLRQDLDEARFHADNQAREFTSDLSHYSLEATKLFYNSLTVSLQNAANLRKEFNKNEIADTKAKYDLGEIDAANYFAVQRKLATEEFEDQKALAQEKVFAAQATVNKSGGFDANTQKQAAQALSAAQADLDRLQYQRTFDQAAIDREEAEAKIENLKKTRDLQNEILDSQTLTGTSAATIAAKYQDIADSSNHADDAVIKIAESMKEQANELARIDALNKNANASAQAAIDIQQAQLDLQKENLTSAESGARQDAITQAKQIQAVKEINDLEKTRATYQGQLDDALLNEAGAIDPDSFDQLDEAAEGLQGKLSGVNTEIEQANAKFIALAGNIGVAGKRLEEGFKDSISQGLTEALTDPLKGGQAFAGIAKSIQHQLTGEVVSSNVTKMFQNLDKKYGYDEVVKDKNGNPLTGPDGEPLKKHVTPFDSLAQSLGLEKKTPLGETSAHPVHTIVDNIDRVGGAHVLGGTRSNDSDTVGNFGFPSTTMAAQLPGGEATGGGTSVLSQAAASASDSGVSVGGVTPSGALGLWHALREGAKQRSAAKRDAAVLKSEPKYGDDGNYTFGSPSSLVPTASQGTTTIAAGGNGEDDPYSAAAGLANTVYPDTAAPNTTSATSGGAPLSPGSMTAGGGSKAGTTAYTSKAPSSSSGGLISGLINSGLDAYNKIKNAYSDQDSKDQQNAQSLGASGAYAGGGRIAGKGSGISDSIPAMLSHGEFVMNAQSTSRWLPLLEQMNNGSMQSIAMPRSVARYASGGVVSQAAAISSIQHSPMLVQLHPDSLNMTMSDWLSHEVSRQYANR